MARGARRIALAALAIFSGSASAQRADAWQFEGMPYLWAAGMKGDVGVGRIAVDGVEMSFPDIAKSLRAGFMGSLEGRKGEWGFLADMIYMQVHQKHPATRGFTGDVDAKMTQQAYSLAAIWRASPAVDLLAGARTNYVKADLDLASSALTPQGRTFAKSRDWVDGFVGVRARVAIDDRWTLVGYADLGAGGSDSTWQLMAGADYAISPTATAKFGYRYFKVDYERDDFKWNMASAGIYLGVGIRF